MSEPNDPFAVPEQPAGQQPGGYPPPPPLPPPGSTPSPGQPGGYPPPPPLPPTGYGAPPGYGQPPYPPQGYGQKTNTMAIIALVSIFVCSPAGLVFGIIARNQIKQSGEGGSGMALAGIIVGAVSIALIILYFVFIAFALSMGVAAST